MSILFGDPQGSISGPLLFILHICGLFILSDHHEFGSYADDTTSFVYGESFDEILGELEKYMAKISEWFLYYCLKANAKKFHLFVIPFVDNAINIKNITIKSSHAEVSLGVTINSNLSFTKHEMYLCATANRKLHALSRLSKYISLKKRRILTKSFIISQSSYCSFIYIPGQNIWNKNTEIQQNRTIQEKFDIYFCVFFNCYYQSLITGGETGRQAMSPL